MPNTSKISALLHLIRFDRPIGTLLLLWPTLSALWVAAQGKPSAYLLVIFVLGTFLTRSAGCVINDYADRNIDGDVTRTQSRPLVMGRITEREALVFFAVLMLLAFALVLFTNTLTIQLSVVAVALAYLYPFMKRYTHLPQVVLGAAFSWGIPMAFAAQTQALPADLWWLFAANLLWTVAYDTQYAMVDREDDIRIGMKSTAILFGHYDRLIIALLQIAVVACLYQFGQAFELGMVFNVSLLAVAALFVHHQYLIRNRDPQSCFRAFLHNNWVGACFFAGIAIHYLSTT
ncbi:MAG: 4-hydroxybenzoate polyprenyltransferase [Bacteroidia bacterium]|jgi:4-hydroxybenzoate polyprenyltransferase